MIGSNNTSGRIFPRAGAAFTLIETLVGSVLTVIVFGALLVAIAHGYRVMDSTRQNLRATQILMERMEGLRLYTWDQLVRNNMMPAEFQAYFSPADQSGTNSSGVVYYGTMGIGNVTLDTTPSYASSMRQVTVSVVWTNNGVLHERSMSTLVSRHGIQNYLIVR